MEKTYIVHQRIFGVISLALSTWQKIWVADIVYVNMLEMGRFNRAGMKAKQAPRCITDRQEKPSFSSSSPLENTLENTTYVYILKKEFYHSQLLKPLLCVNL